MMSDLVERLRELAAIDNCQASIEAAERIEAAVQKVLSQGLRTGDIWSEGTTKVGTAQMGDAVVKAMR